MKKIMFFVVWCVLALQTFAQDEVELTNLAGNPSDPKILSQQTLLQKKVADAMSALKIANVITLEVVVRKEEDLAKAVYTAKIPTFNKKLPHYAIHIYPDILMRSELFLEHMVYHELVSLINESFHAAADIENHEIERRVEIDVYRAVGKKRYLEYIKEAYDREGVAQTQSFESFAEIQLRYLGLYEEKKADQ